MGSNVSRAQGKDYRGLIVPDPTLQSDVAATQEAGPYPTIAADPLFTAAQWTGMVAECSGAFPATASTSPEHYITTVHPGMPGIQDARFAYMPILGSASQLSYLFCDSPNAISRYSNVTSGHTGVALGSCLRLQDNSVAFVYTRTDGGAPTQVVFRSDRPDTGSYNSTGATLRTWPGAYESVLFAPSSASSFVKAVTGATCLLQLPNGRIHAYWITKNTAVSTESYYQLQMGFSDDSGLTWQLATPTQLLLRNPPGPEGILNKTINADGTPGAGSKGFEITRIRAAYSNGQVLLLIHGTAHDTSYTYTDTIWQYASSDLGNTFERIDIASGGSADWCGGYIAGAGGGAAVSYFDLVTAVDGAFVVAWVQVYDTAGPDIRYVRATRMGSAYSPWTDVYLDEQAVVMDQGRGADFGTVTSNIVTGTEVSIAVDETGLLVVSASQEANGRVFVGMSQDNGTTWLGVNGSYGTYAYTGAVLGLTIDDNYTWWDSGDTKMYPSGYITCMQFGRLVVLTLSAAGTEQQSPTVDRTRIVSIELGGYTTTNRPFRYPIHQDNTQAMWNLTWLPWKSLSNTTGWTFAGTGTEVLSGGDYSTLTTGVGQTITITNTTFSAITGGELRAFGQFECKVTNGSSRLEVLIGDGANIAQVWMEFTTTNFIVKDIAAGATLYNQAAPAPADWNTVMFCMDWSSKTLTVAYRGSATNGESRGWSEVRRLVFGTAASIAVSRWRVDQPASSTSLWRQVHVGSGHHGYPMLSEPAETNSDLVRLERYGRAWTGLPVSLVGGDGPRLRAVDGPTWIGDNWTIAQAHHFSVRNVLPGVSASPRRTWRSTSVASNVTLTFTADTAINSPTPGLGSVFAIALFNANFASANVEYQATHGGAWAALGTISLNYGQTNLVWTQGGNVVRVDSGTAHHADDYYTYNILEDSHFLLTNPSGQNHNPYPVRIRTNTEGAWNSTTTTRPRLFIEAPNIVLDTSGSTGEIWSKDGVLIIHDMPAFAGIRITIPASATAEGYFEIGTIIMGHVAYFGRQYARQRALNWTPNTALTTGRGGARRAQVLGPVRRSIEFAWANENETDASPLGVTGPSPDYILPATGSTNPVASPADTAWKMAGLVEYASGSALPLVYLSKVPMVASEATDTMLVNRNLFMLGRIVSEPRIDTVLGEEWSSAKGELVRVATVTFEEEV